MAKRKSNLSDILAPIADVVSRLTDRRADLMAEVDLIDDQLGTLGGVTANGLRGKGKAKGTKGGKGKGKRTRRVRRSREDLEAMANEVITFIKGKGKEGASGKEITGQFGDLLPSVNAWLKNYAKGAKVKTTGAKSAMRYSV